ncbi:FAD-binding oxidoreductase [Roseivivax sp. THAF30]|uniref:NAD(P)/FAD-dependent oxidoreductase n=1 Tax=Roseivivax sp. THAF30 TaxID=2587852 RepID=UPI0012685FC0|nr:FAD-dependent oxidoreductase [Roseivivax sp. THAF30]QFT64298.1 D-amino acid dehydrogenase small subunit [Roseivivax sp. THAF30]
MRVAVIGAGIVGVSSAIWLRRLGADVTLIERGDPGAAASWGNAGVLAASAVRPSLDAAAIRRAPGMLLDRDAPLFLRWAYLPKVLPWLLRAARHAGQAEVARIGAALETLVTDAVESHEALAKGTRAEAFLRRSDYVYAYQDMRAYTADAAALAIKARAGFPHERIEGRAVQEYDPALGPGIGCLAVMKDHGFIADPGAYVSALAQTFEAEGGTLWRAKAQHLVLEDGQVHGVIADGETRAYERVVVAAGLGSRALLAEAGLDLPLETERGYHLQLSDKAGGPRQPTMVASGQFVATPMTDGTRLAGILEFGGTEAGPSRAPFGLLRRQAAEAFPNLALGTAREWMGHRPALPDSLPLLGEIGQSGLWGAVGHHHVGLTAGPKTGRLLAEALMGRRPNVDLAPYAARRFGHG